MAALVIWTKMWVLGGFLAAEIAAFVAIVSLLGWICRKHSRWRNPSAFVLACAAAYVARFTLEVTILAIFQPVPPETLAVIPLWLGVAIATHWLSWRAALSKRPVWLGYLIVGAIGVSVAPDGRVLVAALCVAVLGFGFMVLPKGEPARDFRVLVWDYAGRDAAHDPAGPGSSVRK
jgi:hypothetical protein